MLPSTVAMVTTLCFLPVFVAAMTTPTTTSVVRAAVRRLVETSGSSRCSLAELGEQLRKTGIGLPEGMSLQGLVANDDQLRLSGPKNHRKVGLLADSTESVLVERVSSVLRLHGAPMSSAELQLRLSAERQRVPGLMSLLRRHPTVFEIDMGTVRLAGAEYDSSTNLGGENGSGESSDAADTAVPSPFAATLTRLRALSLPDTMHESELAPLAAMRDFVVLDLDNQAFVGLERAAAFAEANAHTFILAGCAGPHNPRLPTATGEQLQRLAREGRLRLLSPKRDCPNGADFVLAFWVGWLHARAANGARFVLLSEDASLAQTVGDLLKDRDRDVVANPPSFPGLGHAQGGGGN